MRTIDKGTNWGRRARNFGVASLILGGLWVLLQSSLE